MKRHYIAFVIVFASPLLCDACPRQVVVYQPAPSAPQCVVPKQYIVYQSYYRHSCCLFGCRPIQYMQVIEQKPAEEAKKAAAPTVVVSSKEPEAPEGWCHIKGRVIWDIKAGRLPKRERIQPTKDKEIANKDPELFTENWVVNPANYGIRDVVVWLAPEPTEAQLNALMSGKQREFPSFKSMEVHPAVSHLSDPTIEMDIFCCRFTPHVLAARAGQNLVIKNTSPAPHNAKWVSRNNGEFNPLIPPGGQFQIKGLKAERFPLELSCSIHPWMQAWVRVFDHPYFAVTDKDGNFEIRFAPKGNLRFFVWQENGIRGGAPGRFGEKIQVPSGRLNLGEIKFNEVKSPNK